MPNRDIEEVLLSLEEAAKAISSKYINRPNTLHLRESLISEITNLFKYNFDHVHSERFFPDESKGQGKFCVYYKSEGDIKFEVATFTIKH